MMPCLPGYTVCAARSKAEPPGDPAQLGDVVKPLACHCLLKALGEVVCHPSDGEYRGDGSQALPHNHYQPSGEYYCSPAVSTVTSSGHIVTLICANRYQIRALTQLAGFGSQIQLPASQSCQKRRLLLAHSSWKTGTITI